MMHQRELSQPPRGCELVPADVALEVYQLQLPKLTRDIKSLCVCVCVCVRVCVCVCEIPVILNVGSHEKKKRKKVLCA